MANTLRNPYSTTAGNTPATLGNGVIAVNQADGRLFYRASPSGAVTQYQSPQILEYATTGNFPGTGTTARLYCATDTGRLYRYDGSVYYEVGGRSFLTSTNPWPWIFD